MPWDTGTTSRLAAAASVVVGLAGLPVAAAIPVAAAAPPIRISVIRYNPPGADTTSSAQLNGEYLVLKNTTATARSITGWTLRDVQGHLYRFGSTSLAAGATLRLHTGPGTSSRTDRYWNQRFYIWNNDRDTAILKNAAGATVQTCSYIAPSTSTTYNGVKTC